jgi:hypothetical protein
MHDSDVEADAAGGVASPKKEGSAGLEAQPRPERVEGDGETGSGLDEAAADDLGGDAVGVDGGIEREQEGVLPPGHEPAIEQRHRDATAADDAVGDATGAQAVALLPAEGAAEGKRAKKTPPTVTST